MDLIARPAAPSVGLSVSPWVKWVKRGLIRLQTVYELFEASESLLVSDHARQSLVMADLVVEFDTLFAHPGVSLSQKPFAAKLLGRSFVLKSVWDRSNGRISPIPLASRVRAYREGTTCTVTISS
jgi:hypothetical protein